MLVVGLCLIGIGLVGLLYYTHSEREAIQFRRDKLHTRKMLNLCFERIDNVETQLHEICMKL